jgi:uncharacterized damage-inducible protein DinB
MVLKIAELLEQPETTLSCDIAIYSGKFLKARASKPLWRKFMIKGMLTALLAAMLTIPASAQDKQQSTPSNPLSTWLHNAYANDRNNIVRSAQKVPEDFYGLRPGPQTEVRTFGQIVGHLANFNYLWCSQAKGEKDPNEGNDFESVTSKAGLLKALNDAFSYCDGVYGTLTDATAREMVNIIQENGRPARVVRMSLLILNYGHNNEHYGNLVTYMRMKSIVPASSEPRPR